MCLFLWLQKWKEAERGVKEGKMGFKEKQEWVKEKLIYVSEPGSVSVFEKVLKSGHMTK